MIESINKLWLNYSIFRFKLHITAEDQRQTKTSMSLLIWITLQFNFEKILLKNLK